MAACGSAGTRCCANSAFRLAQRASLTAASSTDMASSSSTSATQRRSVNRTRSRRSRIADHTSRSGNARRTRNSPFPNPKSQISNPKSKIPIPNSQFTTHHSQFTDTFCMLIAAYNAYSFDLDAQPPSHRGFRAKDPNFTHRPKPYGRI